VYVLWVVEWFNYSDFLRNSLNEGSDGVAGNSSITLKALTYTRIVVALSAAATLVRVVVSLASGTGSSVVVVCGNGVGTGL